MHRFGSVSSFSRARFLTLSIAPALCLCFATASLSARAQNLGISSSQASVTDNTGKTTYATGQCLSVTYAQACAAYGSDSTVTALASNNFGASAFAAFGFEVVGPPGSDPVLDISGDASATGSGYAGEVGLELFNNNCCTEYLESYYGGNPAPGQFYFSVPWSSNALSLFFVGTGCGPGSGSCSSSIDPTIIIDPNWLADNPGYTLIEDSDEFAVATSPTPEPASLLLLASGLLGVLPQTAPRIRRILSRQRS